MGRLFSVGWLGLRLFSLLLFLPLPCTPLAVFSTSGSKRVTLPVYSHILARNTFTEHNVSIVDITMDVKVFDFCDLSLYTPQAIAPLLTLHGVKAATNSSGMTNWVAYFNASFPQVCYSRVNSFQSRVSLYWLQIFSLQVEKSGACGYLYPCKDYACPSKYLTLPYTSISKDNVYSVFGEVVSVFGSYTDLKNEVVLLSLLRERNHSLMADTFASDYSAIDGALLPWSLFRITGYLLIILSLYTSYLSVALTQQYYKAKRGRLPLNYCTGSLLINILGNVIRLIKLVDLGVSYIAHVFLS
jgi:hypothetical protein